MAVRPASFFSAAAAAAAKKTTAGGDSAADLVASADARPHDADAQAAALAALASEAPHEAIKRFESGEYASNDAAMKAYLTALVRANRLGQTNLRRTLADTLGGGGAATAATATPTLASPLRMSWQANGGSSGGGTAENPLFVAMPEPTFRQQLWRLVRSLLLVLIVVSAMNQVMEERGLGGKGGSAGQEVLPESSDQRHTFADVQGADEAKAELQQVVQYLRNPSEFTRLGGRLPKGILLKGPPGTGKTLLARAVAGEAGVPFFYCSGSEFDEMFVGVGARRVRELFAAAKKKQPCIIFMDEIDAIGGKRSAKDQQFTKMTLNQLLVELDGFKQNEGIIVIAATNFPEMLDAALTRPGRFDTHVTVALPDRVGREKILTAHAAGVPLADPADLQKIARGTPGFSGAELANIINQAALKASQDGRRNVDLRTLEWAKDKILMGAERKTAVMSDKDRRLTAYHEAGHALCALYTDGAEPVYKATIIPRGDALGMVTQLPEDDRNSMTRKEMLARLVVCMGGRAAEERVFGHDAVTSGASSDVDQATRLAHAMVTRFAMSSKVGPIRIADDQEVSPELRQLVESETRALCAEALARAHAVLQEHSVEHERLAAALLDHEDLTAEEMRLVVKGQPLPPRT